MSEAREIADAVARYFGSQRSVVRRARFTRDTFACEADVIVSTEDFGHMSAMELGSATKKADIPDDATLIEVEWNDGGKRARVRLGWGGTIPAAFSE